MTWMFTANLDEFPEAAEAWLRRDPVRNTAPITVLGRVRHGMWTDGAMFGWLSVDGEVDGVVLHTPPYRLLLADIPLASVPSLAEAVRHREAPGVSGPVAQVEAFVSASQRRSTGRTSMRLYQLETLRPASSTGMARMADGDDIPLVAQWLSAFMREADPENAVEDPLPQVTHRVGRREFVLWEDGGRPVAIAGFSRPITTMSRIGPVYTPPESRGRGYGSAVTHAATRAAQDSGADVLLLFTDLANPTSNSIYQAIGYRPVADYADVRLAAPV